MNKSQKKFFTNQIQELRKQLVIDGNDAFFEEDFEPFDEALENDDFNYGQKDI